MSAPHEVFNNYLGRKRLKMTRQRKIILDVFLETEGHFSAEEFFERLKAQESGIGQSTIYRTLKLLTESGLAEEVNFGDGIVRYEHKYGHTPHAHLVCSNCGKTEEVSDDRVHNLFQELAGEHGYTFSHHEVMAYGICPACQRKK